MANYANLKAAIDAVIKANGQQEITGPLLNQVLKAMVNALGAGYLFMGIAEHDTNPNTPDQNVFYIALEEGTYTHFGNAQVHFGISLLFWYGQWSVYNLVTFSNEVTNEVEEIPTSYAVFNALKDAAVYDVTAHTGQRFANLNSLLSSPDIDTLIPPSVRKAGMTIMFTSPARPVQQQSQLFKHKFFFNAVDVSLITNVNRWIGIETTVTQNSLNVPTSGAVYAAVNTAKVDTIAEAGVYDVTANNDGATFASLSALLNDEDLETLIPVARRKGGMSIKYVSTSDNNYVKFFCTADEFSTDVEDWEQSASIEKLESGEIVPKLAQNLESWEEDGGQDVSNTWDETIRTTAGDDPIDTTQGGVLKKIVAKTDFVCSGLLATAYNQLRLKSNGGGAVAVGTGWYFPVPKLILGDFGSAQENNGLLLTDNNGNNIQNATVYFKALADGVPTSVTDGTQLSPTSVSYNGKTYKVYTTSGAGYLIVSGITYDNTCAHISWEDWYDKFVSPTDPADVGDNISLTALFAAVPNSSGKFLVCGGVATYAERISNTQMKITDPIGRVTSPSWTNTLQDDGETYLHSLAVSGMKSGGYALIEGSDQVLIVEGTTVKYSDTNATAISGVVRYEKSTAATATVTLTKTSYVLNDCGIEMKEGAEGSAFFTNTYTQNIPDALSQIAKVKLDSSLGVIAEALLYLYNENKALRDILTGRDNAIMAYIKAINIECEQITMFGAPLVLRCSTAGAPSAANIPVNWDEKTMDVWNGTPRFRGQQYIDTTNSKVYYAVKLTGSTSDWVALN